MSVPVNPSVIDARNALISAIQSIHLAAYRGGSERGQRIDSEDADLLVHIKKLVAEGMLKRGRPNPDSDEPTMVELTAQEATCVFEEFMSMRNACDNVLKLLEKIPALVESIVAATCAKFVGDAEPYSWTAGVSKDGAQIIIEPSQSGGWCFYPHSGRNEFKTLSECIEAVKMQKAEGKI